ncbi:MAG: DUF4974 domain-containing protein [Chitinophagaceae bacterium]|nr:DUF4974 domain-containing protein [Chitinophagaceae bacterium]
MNEDWVNNKDETAYRVAYLVAGFIKGTLTSVEHDELDDWVASSDENMQVFERLTDASSIGELEKTVSRSQLQERLAQDKRQLDFSSTSRPSKKSNTINLLVFSAAACILVAAGIFLFWQNDKPAGSAGTSVTVEDASPASYRAMLTLGDGTELAVTDKSEGSIAHDNSVGIAQSDNALVYTDSGRSHELVNNKLTVPLQGFFKLVLSDGTKVWLNAGSELIYPVAFTGKDRSVQLKGEGYFEVFKNAAKPFKVEAGGITTLVLGTHFNITSYDHSDVAITLLEGRITTESPRGNFTLKPGEQIVATTESILKRTGADTSAIIGWKNGVFEFRDSPISEIMKQLSRWYGVRINYEATPDYLFNATIDRSVPLSKILRYLQLTNKVHFKFENQTITVLK